jgi:hypothetical protein
VIDEALRAHLLDGAAQPAHKTVATFGEEIVIVDGASVGIGTRVRGEAAADDPVVAINRCRRRPVGPGERDDGPSPGVSRTDIR